MIMKNLLLHLWQLPQHLVAWIILLMPGEKKQGKYGQSVVYAKNFMKGKGEGVCFGKYIFVDPVYFSGNSYYNTSATIAHEYGHSRQSLILGPLYLFTVGICSIMIPFDGPRYYTVWCEKWANKLGGVKVTITGDRSCDYKLEML
jgi:hypothetical protein